MLKEMTLWFNFDVMWIAKNCGPDCMSRTKEARLDCMMGFAASNCDTEVPVDETNIIDSYQSIISWSNDEICTVIFEEIKIEVSKDQEMLDLVRAIRNKDESDRFPDRS